jgi:hypothetical protein
MKPGPYRNFARDIYKNICQVNPRVFVYFGKYTPGEGGYPAMAFGEII